MIVAVCAMNIQDPLLLYYENNASGFHVKFPVEYRILHDTGLDRLDGTLTCLDMVNDLHSLTDL